MKNALIGAFSWHCDISQSPVDSSNSYILLCYSIHDTLRITLIQYLHGCCTRRADNHLEVDTQETKNREIANAANSEVISNTCFSKHSKRIRTQGL